MLAGKSDGYMTNEIDFKFKDWSVKKIHFMLKIHPYYDKENLARILNCTVKDIDDFENAIKDSKIKK